MTTPLPSHRHAPPTPRTPPTPPTTPLQGLPSATKPIVRSKKGSATRRNRIVKSKSLPPARLSPEELIQLLVNVRTKLLKYEITLVDLASFVGACPVTVSRWFNGHNYPSMRMSKYLMMFLDARVVGEGEFTPITPVPPIATPTTPEPADSSEGSTK